MRHRGRTRGEQGLALIELIVAVGIIGFISLAIASVMTDLLKNQNSVRFRSQTDTLQEEVRGLLSSEAACASTLAPVVLNGATNKAIASIKDATGIDRFVTGQSYENYDLISTTLENYADSAGLSGNAVLRLVTRISSEAVGPQELTRRINIRTERDGARNLVRCVATAKMTDGIWQRNPASINDVFFMGNNVGIRTSSPGHALSVNGGLGLGPTPFLPDPAYTTMTSYITFRHASVSEDFIGYRDNTFYFADAPLGGDVSHPTVNMMGRLGVGGENTGNVPLDVVGEMKIGSTGLSCDPSTAGAMRYNSGLAIMEYCGGSPVQWRRLSPPETVNPVQTGPTTFVCPTGYTLRHLHYNVGNSNNAFWVVCDPAP